MSALVVKNPPANAGDATDMGSIPGSGRSPGQGNGNPLQYSCLENPNGQRNLMGYSTAQDILYYNLMNNYRKISSVQSLNSVQSLSRV